MPLSSHNCFVLRGRETRINVSAILFVLSKPIHAFLQGFWLLFCFCLNLHLLTVLRIQAPLKCLRFHFRGWCKRDKSQRHLKDSLSNVSVLGRLERRGGTTHLTSQRTSWLRCAASTSLLCSFRRSLGCAFCSCCCSFRGFSIPLSSSLIAVPLKLRSAHDQGSPCQEQAGLTACGAACWGKGKIFQCGTLSYKGREMPTPGRGCGKEVCSGWSSSLNFDSLMIGIRRHLRLEYWSSPM